MNQQGNKSPKMKPTPPVSTLQESAHKKEPTPQADVQQYQSVWDMPFFPHHQRGPKYKITPQKLKEAIQEYRESIEPLQDVLTKYGVNWRTWIDLRDGYPEISRFERAAAREKARHYGRAAIEIYKTGQIPEDLYETDKNGCRRLSVAGVKWCSDRHNALLRHAEIHQTGSYVRRSEVDQRSLSVTATIRVQATPDELNTMDAGGLQALLGSLARGGAELEL